jgi:hypothetical protein
MRQKVFGTGCAEKAASGHVLGPDAASLAQKETWMLKSSRTHLQEAGETYGEHMRFAAMVALMAIGAGLACLVHAFVPALCRGTCSATIRELYWLFDNRGELARAKGYASGPIVFAGLFALSSFASAPLLLAASHEWWSWLIAALAFAIPAAFLGTNPQLEPVVEDLAVGGAARSVS